VTKLEPMAVAMTILNLTFGSLSSCLKLFYCCWSMDILN